MNQCRKPTLADRPWIQRIYESSGYRGAEYTFANLYLWSFYYGEVAEVEGYLCQRLNFRGVHQYLYPAGSGDIRPVLERIFADSRREGKPLVIRSLTRETMAQLESLYPGQFTYEPDRDSYDYLYEIGTLADLPGRKLQSKRNHINRFIEAWPNWYTRVITPHNLHEDIAGKFRDFLRQMGLRFGAFDLIVTPDGGHVFLECNPNGQWLWVELATGMPISEAIADELMKQEPAPQKG